MKYMEKRIRISHTIEKQREKTYYAVPFSVPEGVERMTVSYHYEKGTKAAPNVVDLGLSDEKGRFVGWSGGARQSVTVGPCEATPGYWMTEIGPGEWQILVGAYKIAGQSLAVEYEVTFYEKEARWLFGDLHCHSTASDGALSSWELAQRARRMGFDFLAVSDHNNYCGNYSLPKVPGLTMIPAVEWTHYKGHMNFFGAAAPFENSFVANTQAEMLSLVKQAKESGALVSANHPKCPFCPYLWEDDSCFDLMEIWNGPMRRANMDALAWWHRFLVQGRKLPVVGGSDFHRDKSPVRLGNPVTAVFCASPAAEDIVEAIRQGHCYVTESIKGVRLELEGSCFGDTLKGQRGKTLRFKASGGKQGMRFCLVSDAGMVCETSRWKGKEATLEVAAGQEKFFYAAVYRRAFGKSWLCAISNPVYLEA